MRWTLLFLLIFTASACFAQAPKTIGIGAIFDLSGGGVIWGKAEREAFLLAIKDFEAAHPDIKVHFKIEDSTFQNKQAVSAFQKLTAIDKFQYIIGPTWETYAVIMPLCESRKIVCLSPSYNGREFLSKDWNYNFTAWFDDKSYSEALAVEGNNRNFKKIGIFSAITPYYDLLVENFVSTSKTKPIFTHFVQLKERDLRALITKSPPEMDGILMLLDNTGQIQDFLKQWSELRQDRPLILSDDLVIYLDPPEDILKYGFKIFYSYPHFEEEAKQRFYRKFRSEYGHAPEAASASVTYDETMLLLSCILKDNTPAAVRSCIATTENYSGYSGTFSFGGRDSASGREIKVRELRKEQ